MKRYLILFLILSLLLPCLVVSASASSANVVDAIQNQTQTMNDYLYSQFQDLKQFLETYFSIWSSRFVNIQNYLSSILGYFTDDTYGVYSEGNKLYNVTHFEMDLIDVWGFNWQWLYDYFFTNDQTYYYYTISNTSSGLGFRSTKITGTAFQRDLSSLSYDLIYSLYTALSKIYNVLLGDSTVSDAVRDQVDQDSTEASEYLDIMDDVTKPDVGELEDLSNISGYVNAGDVSVLAACLAPFFQSAIFLPCIMLSLIFMLVAYVLYGKR